MNAAVIGLLGIFLLLLLLAGRMQVGFAMALIGFLGFSLLNSLDAGLGVMAMEPFKTGSSYTLSVVPLFILMGQLATQSGLGAEVYEMVHRFLGHRPGGLAMATVGACACFAAISGSSLATAATMGLVALPEMKKYGYADTLATGCIAAGGTLGILIPPSTVLIVYGILTEQSISRLFVAGILPGLLLSFLFMVVVYVQARLRPDQAPPGPRYSRREKLAVLKNTWGLLTLFLLVMGGLYTGWFTPTEAAGVGACGALLITLIKGRLTWTALTSALKEAVMTTGMVYAILIGANIFQYFLTISQLPDQIYTRVIACSCDPYLVMVLILILFIILGCFLEGLSILILTMPIVFPIVKDLGFDPVWFGIVLTLVIEMGLITPPVGVNVFILSGVAKDVPMSRIFRGVAPFWLALLAAIAALLVIPPIALFLPNTMH